MKYLLLLLALSGSGCSVLTVPMESYHENSVKLEAEYTAGTAAINTGIEHLMKPFVTQPSSGDSARLRCVVPTDPKAEKVASFEVLDPATSAMLATQTVYTTGCPAPAEGAGWQAASMLVKAMQSRDRLEAIKAITSMARSAYLRPRASIKAPVGAGEIVQQVAGALPGLSDTLGLVQLGKAGIEAAGDITHAVLNNGSTLGTGGAQGQQGLSNAPIIDIATETTTTE